MAAISRKRMIANPTRIIIPRLASGFSVPPLRRQRGKRVAVRAWVYRSTDLLFMHCNERIDHKQRLWSIGEAHCALQNRSFPTKLANVDHFCGLYDQLYIVTNWSLGEERWFLLSDPVLWASTEYLWMAQGLSFRHVACRTRQVLCRDTARLKWRIRDGPRIDRLDCFRVLFRSHPCRWRQCAGYNAHCHYRIWYACCSMPSSGCSPLHSWCCLWRSMDVCQWLCFLVRLTSSCCRDVDDIGFLEIILDCSSDPVTFLVPYRQMSEIDWAWIDPTQRWHPYRFYWFPAGNAYNFPEWWLS